MTLRTAPPEVPKRLPHARIYLDDIEQVADLFREIAATAGSNPANPDTTTTDAPIHFQVGNQVTSEIAELPKVAAETRQLTVTYYQRGLFLLFDVDQRGTGWWERGLPYPLAWQTHHQLEEILKRRPLRLIDGFRLSGAGSMRNWVSLALAVVLGSFLVHFLPVPSHKLPGGYLRALVLTCALGLLAVALLGLRYTIRETGPSVVVLDYSYKHAERRRERNSKLLFTLLGWLLGVVSGILLLKLKH
jgi:hypothetical protein